MQKFSIKNRYGLTIVGELLQPEQPTGLAFLMHGLGGMKEQKHILLLADSLYEQNYTVVNFDATNSIGESEGKYENATLGLHYEDLVDVIAWAKGESWYLEPFLLTGHSMGGYAVARYAEDHPREVKAVFPNAPVVSGDLSHEATKKFNPEKFTKWKETGWTSRMSNSKPGTELRLPWSHMEERLEHDLLPKAGELTMPVLIVVGENDHSCPPDAQRMFFDLIPKNPKSELRIVLNAGHSFKEQEQLTVLKEIFDNWLAKI